MSNVEKVGSASPELPEVALSHSDLSRAANEIARANLAFREELKRGTPTAETYERLRMLAPASVQTADLPYWAGKVHEAKHELDLRERALSDSTAVQRGMQPSSVALDGIAAADSQLARIIGGYEYGAVRHGSALTSSEAALARDRDLANESRPHITAALKTYESVYAPVRSYGPPDAGLTERLAAYHEATTAYYRIHESEPFGAAFNSMAYATWDLRDVAPADVGANLEQWAHDLIVEHGIGREDALGNFYRAEREMNEIGPVDIEGVAAEARYERALAEVQMYAPAHLHTRDTVAEWAQTESAAHLASTLDKYHQGTATLDDLRAYAPVDMDSPEKVTEWAQQAATEIPTGGLAASETETLARGGPVMHKVADPVALAEALEDYRDAALNFSNVTPPELEYPEYEAAYERALAQVRPFAPTGLDTPEAIAGWANAAAAVNVDKIDLQQVAADLALGAPVAIADRVSPTDLADLIDTPVSAGAREGMLRGEMPTSTARLEELPADTTLPLGPAAIEAHVGRIEGLLDVANASAPDSVEHANAFRELVHFSPDSVSRENVIAWAEAVSDAANVCRDMPPGPDLDALRTVGEVQLIAVLGGENWETIASQAELANAERASDIEASAARVFDDVANYIGAQVDRIEFDFQVRVAAYIEAAGHLEALGTQHAGPAEYAEAHQTFEAASETLREQIAFYAPDTNLESASELDTWASNVWAHVGELDRQFIAELHIAPPGEDGFGERLAARLESGESGAPGTDAKVESEGPGSIESLSKSSGSREAPGLGMD
ncbi:hypothetical protein [Paraburkholderia sp. C35]|uniref:hypothetical protein n=1 Tax=Paraburkholderia sp. C35 TaxID=2126993 RepID=UPI0013A53585|nr:hypothetical protein [Paraburkholderia sp. C35]